ncbi:putative HAD superfamily hydrolase [Lysinibacillus sp. RC79]
MSWTPNEYKALLKGAQMRMVSDYENLAIQAMYIRKADNAKRLKLTDLFDAEKARKRILEGDKDWKESKKMDTTLYKKAQADMKAWAQNLTMK